MIINSSRFGEIEVSEEKAIYFEHGLPGLDKLKRFIFLTPDNTWPFYFLQSLDDFNVSLPVMNPYNVMQDYNISVNENVLEEIELNDVEDILILNVVVIPGKVHRMTINMAAPIIINVKALKGRQVILDNSSYPIRYPLYDAFVSLKNGGGRDAGSVKEEE